MFGVLGSISPLPDKSVFFVTDANTNKRFIKVEFSDDITKVNTVTFVDENGETLIDNVDFTVSKTQNQDLTDDVETIETDNTNELNIEAEEIPDRPFYILVNGKDGRGTFLSRVERPPVKKEGNAKTRVHCRKRLHQAIIF